MKHCIEVNDIRLYGYHGCLKEELAIGGHYLVSVFVETNFAEAAQTDDLSKTIDYVAINKIVQEQMAIPSKLIEHVAQRIVDQLKKTFETIQKVRVVVRKLTPPINGDVRDVTVSIEEE